MADGQILIDTKIRTDEAKQETQNLKSQLEKLAESASASAKKIDRSFSDIELEDTADGLGDSFKKEAKEVDKIPDEIESGFDNINLEDAADGLSEGFEDEADKVRDIPEEIEESFEDIDLDNSADGLAESFDDAWDDVRRSSSRGADHVKDELDDIGDEASGVGKLIKSKLKDAFDSISGGFGEGFADGIFAGMSSELADVALEVLEDLVGELVEFGKQSIELASNLQEVQNVVDVTFGSMSDAVNKFAKDALMTAGLSETMAKQFTGTFGAMAKSFGFTQSEALEMSTTLTQLAGDIASFYNISHEEAFTKLQAVFTGETEALKELGVVMTETALNAYALEKGIGKTTQQMSEQEKAALRYQFVLDKLSDASGDFARTQGEWANQTKMLSEQWKNFSTEVGKGLISMFEPGVQFLNSSVMPALTNIGKVIGALGKMIGTSIKAVLVPLELMGTIITLVADKFGRFADIVGVGFDWIASGLDWILEKIRKMNAELNKTPEEFEKIFDAGAAAAEMAQGVGQAADDVTASVALLRQEYDAAKEAAHDSLLSQVGYFDELTVKSDMSTSDIVANWEKQKEAFDQYTANMQKAVQLGLDETLVAQLSDGSQQSMAILHELVNSTDLNVQEINAAFAEVQESRDAVESTMAAIKEGTIAKLEELAGEVSSHWGDMASTVRESISEMQAYINDLQGKDVYVNVITRQLDGPGVNRGSGSSGGSGGAVDFNSYAMPRNIPYLASGAVIPPNAPFTAVLGDQKHGVNVEAPLATIQEAVAQVLGELAPSTQAGFEAVIERQNAILAAIEDIQIGDTTIGRAAARYDRRQNLIRGGSTG